MVDKYFKEGLEKKLQEALEGDLEFSKTNAQEFIQKNQVEIVKRLPEYQKFIGKSILEVHGEIDHEQSITNLLKGAKISRKPAYPETDNDRDILPGLEKRREFIRQMALEIIKSSAAK